jgi:hypothetical protein
MPREISPSTSHDVDKYYEAVSDSQRAFIDRIREEKKARTRRSPSTRATFAGPAPEPDWRPRLLDKIAELVDENLSGRSDMCRQFAALTRKALYAMGMQSRAYRGTASYQRADGTWMTWDHAWVVTNDDIVIDGNADSIQENPVVGGDIDPAPYWGPRRDLPRDRRIPAGRRFAPEEENDDDVVRVWWPDLKAWMKTEALIPDDAA